MCVATNDAGVVERSVSLTLQSKSRPVVVRMNGRKSSQSVGSRGSVFHSGTPTITVEPVNTVVDAGTTVVLNCQAEGEPSPVIEWSREGRPLLGSDHFSALSNGSLRISSAQKEHTAEYECVARNLLGSVLVSITLTVRGELASFFQQIRKKSKCSTQQM